MISEENKDEYTWEIFAKDLALTTQLNHSEAWNITYELRTISWLHPYDCFQTIQKMVIFLMPAVGDMGATKFASQLVKFATQCVPPKE